MAPLLAFLPAILSAIGLGAGFIQNRKNKRAQEHQNALDRQFSWDMYHQQRNDAMSDFNLQNEYNSPMQMMQRLKQAGLSPHLFYGGSGNTPSAVIRSAQAGSGNQPAPKTDLGFVSSTASQFMQLQQAQAATTNIQQQTKLVETDMMLKEAQRLKTLSETDTSKYDLDLKKAMRDIVMQQEREKLTGTILDNSKKVADIEFTLDQNDRNAVASADDHAKKLEEILTIKLSRAKTQAEIDQLTVMIENLKKAGSLQEIELEMKQQGINSSDPAWMRIILMWLLDQ